MGLFGLFCHGIQLRSHDRWPREKVTEYSEKLFRRQLVLAYRRCPFYRAHYRGAGIRPDDLTDLSSEDVPPVDKDMVRANFERIVLAKDGREFVTVRSSGSTGRPATFLYSKRAITIVLSNFVRLSLGGENPIRLSDFPIRTLFLTSVGEGYASVALASTGLEEYRAKSLVVDIRDPYRDWADKIREFRPTYVAGYPSCLRLLVALQLEKKIDIRPKKIIAGGEPLTADMKKLLVGTFGADVIDYYASSESLFIGAGSSWYEGVYLYDDMNYVEVDAAGHLIITPLYNDVFPLIRYRLDDVVVGFSCRATGPLPYTHVDRVAGRAEDLLWFRNPRGEWDFLHPLFIDDLEVPGVGEYQFVQTGERDFIVRLVTEPGACAGHVLEETRRQVREFLERKSLPNVKFSVQIVDALPIDEKTGKKRLVIREEGWGPDLPA